MCLFDQFNSPGSRYEKSSLISTLNLQNLSIFMAKCGKFFYFCGKIWQNLGFQMAIFHDARLTYVTVFHNMAILTWLCLF